MILSAIAAMSANRAIGLKNEIPWSLPEDMKFFRNKTLGKIVIVGRRTLESMGGPLPSRKHIVLSNAVDLATAYPSIKVVSTPKAAVQMAELLLAENRGIEPEVMVIGGAQVYEQMLPFLHRIYLTVIHKDFVGDSFFPTIPADEFQIVERVPRDGFDFIIYQRKA